MKHLLNGLLVTATLVVPARAGASVILVTEHNTQVTAGYELINDAQNLYRFTITTVYDPTGPGVGLDGYPSGWVTIDAVAFQLSSLPAFDSGPTIDTVPPDGGTWSLSEKGLSANGCSGGGNFFCFGTGASGSGTTRGASLTDTWAFTLNFPDAMANLSSSFSFDLKMRFLDANHEKVGTLISSDFPITWDCLDCDEQLTSAPEPASLALMGTGLTAIAMRMRRRRAAKTATASK